MVYRSLRRRSWLSILPGLEKWCFPSWRSLIPQLSRQLGEKDSWMLLRSRTPRVSLEILKMLCCYVKKIKQLSNKFKGSFLWNFEGGLSKLMWFECSRSENVSLLSSFSGKLMLHFWKKFNHFHFKRIGDCKMDSVPLVYPESNQTISTENLTSLFHMPWLHALAYWAKVFGLAFNFVIVILLLNFFFQTLMPGKFVWSWRRTGCLQNLRMNTLFALPQPSSSQKSNFGKHLE